MQMLGPYQITGPLGQGGMGQIWRGRADDGTQVALKSVRTTDPGHRAALRRELSLLASLRHPGIVSLLEVGETEQGPWYAMELLDQPTLDHWLTGQAEPAGWNVSTLATDDTTVIDEAPTTPTAQRTAFLALMSRLAHTLAFLHGEGLVHGDLKPSNVMVATDRPVLVDFGLTSRMDAVAPAAGGSAPWMAPERIEGDRLDGRTDLYALGIMLYQGLTGRRPFTGPDVGSVLRAHIEHTPPRVSGVPSALADLVAQLLNKQPSQRPGWADDVARDLASFAGCSVDPDVPPSPHLLRGPLVGRERALTELRSAVGSRTSSVLVGPPGTGRTTLLAAAVRTARQDGWQVFAIHPSGNAPLSALREVLPTLLDHSASASPPSGAVADWLWAQRNASSPSPALPPGSAGPVRRLLDQLLDSAPRPAVIVADDVDQLDPLTAAWIRGLLRTPPPGIAVVASSPTPVEGVSAIEIKGLSRALCGDVLDGMLGTTVPDPLRTTVLDTSRGRPADIATRLAGWLRDGTLRRSQGTWQWPPLHDLEERQDWVVRVRSRLGADAVSALRALAVLGTATAQEVAEVAGLSINMTEAGLGRLIADGWLSTRGSRVEMLATLRQAFASDLPPHEQVELANRACDVLARDPRRVRDRAVVLDRAGRTRDAGFAWWEVGQLAHSLSDLEGAQEAWTHAAERLPEHADYLNVFCATYATLELGEHEAAEATLRAVATGGARPFDRQAAEGGLGRLLWRTARVDEAEQCFRRRLEACQHNAMQRATALADLGSLVHERGDLDHALALAWTAVHTLDDVRPSDLEVRTPLQRPIEELAAVNRAVFMGNVGTALLGLRRFDEAMDVLRQAVTLADDLPDWRVRLLPLRGSHAVALLRHGDFTAAKPRFQRVLSDAQAAGDTLNECVTWQFLARLAFVKGDDPEPWLAPGLRVAEMHGYVLQQATLWGLRAEAAERDRDLDHAVYAATVAEERARKASGTAYIMHILCLRSALARAQGQPDTAMTCVEEARALRTSPASRLEWATERGLVAIMAGDDPLPWLQEAEEHAEGIALSPRHQTLLAELRMRVTAL